MNFEINNELTLSQISGIISAKKKLILSDAAMHRIQHCRDYLDRKMSETGAVFYGINTGFGSLCNTQISNADLEQLQVNLLLSHACGAGDTVPPEIVKLMLLLKIQSLSYGHSGVQIKTVQRLIEMFNHDILPVVYQQGSLGASGDLAPLAHLCLPLIGQGKVWAQQNGDWVMMNADVLQKVYALEPISLQSKEGLALINGTQFMLAYAVWIVLKAGHLSDWADRIAALSVDAFDCRMEPFHPLLHEIRGQHGQIETAKRMREWLKESEIAQQVKTQVQDPYAFRCIPQVHGASKDAIHYAETIFLREMNAVTDNPNVFPDEDLIISGGNFHGQPLAITLDFLAIALAELGSISERRTYQLISGQRGLPPFLAKEPGLHSGMMIPQYTAASIVSQNKQLCTPASVDSIVSSNGQEDHVSMGANAATKCAQVVNNLEKILAIELLNAAQAIEFRRPKQSSVALETWMERYRKVVTFNICDRILHDDIAASIAFINSEKE
ncbi:MAG: histidine ammonia-lyase [Bacteroidia bacterium]|jgi:histidine ammonia-lyase